VSGGGHNGARVVSVQVGRTRELPGLRRGRPVRSAIGKEPVDGRVHLAFAGFDGDEHATRRVRGGVDEAVCVYPAEHIAEWEALLGVALPPGSFGENLRTEGVVDSEARIGAVAAVGGAVVQVAQPRGPCFKLAMRWGRRDLPALMARRALTGWYFRVLEEGDVAAGDELRVLDPGSDVTVADAAHAAYGDGRGDADVAARVLAAPGLAAGWRARTSAERASGR
jgi:MOSC domain-containing protein YiiM